MGPATSLDALPPRWDAARTDVAGDQDRVDMTAGPRRGFGSRSRTGAGWGSGGSKPRRGRKWAELHKRQEDMRQRLDRESRTSTSGSHTRGATLRPH